ncbi:MAG: deoxynucleoside kinase [Candidatus Caldatribacteriota bacterium]|nr:deoxynucleoside kinase [Candidatus Caldatribacteriota bacterium]
MLKFKSKLIVIEGAIGVGKTSLVLQLSDKFNAKYNLEVVEENPFLLKFYNDIERYAFQTQIFFLLSRYKQQLELAQLDLFNQLIFSDYLFAKDRIFAYLNLSGSEFSMYERLYEIMSKNIPKPDLIVYLQASTELLMKRIALRDRPFERKMSYEYMMRLNSTYEDFFSYPDNYQGIKLIKINTNDLDFVGKKEDLEYIINKIFNEGE